MLASEYVPLLACLSCFAVRLDDSTTQIILATLAPYSGERNFYEIYRASTLNHSPTEWQPTHAPSTSGSDSLEAGAPEIEVTPAMIEAGVSAFDLSDIQDVWEGDLKPEVLVAQIYRAMIQESR
jgi:hypothetical protein